MAKSSAEDAELRRACQAAIDHDDPKHKVVMSIRVAKSRGIWGKSGVLNVGSRQGMAKPRVLALCVKAKGQRTKAFLRVLKYSNGGFLESAKLYKLKHLTKMELITGDPSGCTFTLVFDNNIRNHTVAPAQWTMRNVDDRNRILVQILNICKDVSGHLPNVVGLDIVEMAIWAKENSPAVAAAEAQAQAHAHAHAHANPEDGGPVESDVTETELKVNVEKELVSQAEEEDMKILLATHAMMGTGEAEAFSERLKRELQALEAANVHALLECEPLVDEVLQGLEAAAHCVEDMDEWLSIFNVKLRHMREDIEAIETRNNKLEMQSVNNRVLIEEVDKLLEKLNVPPELAASLTAGPLDEARVHRTVEACERLTDVLPGLQVPNIDPAFANMRAVRDRREELENLKTTFVERASAFLTKYFQSLVQFMVTDTYNSQKGKLKRPDHAEIRCRCKTYARLLQLLKGLDKNCLGALRKAYCGSLNLLFRHEAREFSEGLTSAKAPKNPNVWLEAIIGLGQNANPPDTSCLSETYEKMLAVFVPLLVDESSFFADFMCFEVPTVAPPPPPGGTINSDEDGYDDDGAETNDDDLGIDENDSKSGINPAELASLNEFLRDMMDGIQEDVYVIVEWAHTHDPLRCISMHGITERFLSNQKSEVAGFVSLVLGDLESYVSMQFSGFVDEACHQIERYERTGRQTGVLGYIPRFAILATRMEQYIQGQSRDLVDQAYMKFVSIMFVTLEKIAQQIDQRDIFLLENYAAFQNSLYDLANVVPTLAKFYHQASESYEQACTRHLSMLIYYQFDRLFQFAKRIEDLMLNIAPEEIHYQVGMSKADLRKVVKTSFNGVDKYFNAMHKKLQKNLTSEELLPSLWDKCKREFVNKYQSFFQLVHKTYPSENVPTVDEVKDMIAGL